MNIAITSFVLFLILVPGIIFRRFYYTGEFSKQYFKQSAPELLFSTVIPATLLHFFWMFLANKWAHTGINAQALSDIIAANYNSPSWQSSIKKVAASYREMVVYNLSLWFFAATTGMVFKWCIRKTGADRKFKIFRFQNEWFYLLSGEYLDFPKINGSSKNIRIVYVDVLVKTESDDVIYAGILEDYLLSREGTLDLLYIREASKREFQQSGVNFKRIPGRIFVIPYSQVKNINISYLKYNKKV